MKAQKALLEEIRRASGIHTLDPRMVHVDHIFEIQGVPATKEHERK